MTPAVAAALVAAAVLLAGRDAAHRLAAVQPPVGRSTPFAPRSARMRTRQRSWVTPVIAAVAVGAAVGGTAGVVLGLGVGAGAAWSLRRVDGAQPRAHHAQLQREIPLACDLLAACVAAGVSPLLALDEVAGAVSGPLGAILDGVRRGSRLGLAPEAAWSPYLDDAPPELRTLASTLVRSAASGASPARTLDALALDLRERRRLDGEAAARRAGVLMVAPLGLCFLPAFVALGVVPLVAGLVRGGLALLQ